MDVSSALTELETLAQKLSVQVVYDHLTGEGMGTGGLCKVKGSWRVIIERRCSPSERLSILAQALCRFDLEAHFLSPALREVVDRVNPRRPVAPAASPEASPAEAASPEAPAELAVTPEATSAVAAPAVAEATGGRNQTEAGDEGTGGEGGLGRS